MFCLPYTSPRLRYDGCYLGLCCETGSLMHGTGRATTNHTLLALRQQVHPRVPPKTLKIHDDVAGPPPIQERGMTDHLRDVARPIWTIQRRRHLVLRQGSR